MKIKEKEVRKGVKGEEQKRIKMINIFHTQSESYMDCGKDSND